MGSTHQTTNYPLLCPPVHLSTHWFTQPTHLVHLPPSHPFIHPPTHLVIHPKHFTIHLFIIHPPCTHLPCSMHTFIPVVPVINCETETSIAFDMPHTWTRQITHYYTLRCRQTLRSTFYQSWKHRLKWKLRRTIFNVWYDHIRW